MITLPWARRAGVAYPVTQAAALIGMAGWLVWKGREDRK